MPGTDGTAAGGSTERGRKTWRIPYERNNPHPAPFPVALARTAIETTTARTVLDPFVGSGSTGVACAELGREFIGIDNESSYLKIAEQRIAAASLSCDWTGD